MLFDEEIAADTGAAEPVPFFAVLLLGLAERLGVTAGDGSGDGANRGLDGWVIRLDRKVLLLTTAGGLWQAQPAIWSSWDAPTLDWQLLPFAAAPDAFEQAIAARIEEGEAIVTLATPLLSLPDRREALATLLATYVPPSGTDPWSRDNLRLYRDIAEALEVPAD
jgi:hypothetical protein